MQKQSSSECLLSQELTELLQSAFGVALPEADEDVLAAVRAVPATTPEFGDYQCNAALALGKRLQVPPRTLAETAAGHIGQDSRLAKLDVAGPGFINLHLSDEWLSERVSQRAASDSTGIPKPGQGKTIVMDYGSPNITKPLHIGHLRSHNIGSALDRMHRELGYSVIADNHLGDWGTQFGITLRGWLEYGDESRLATDPMEELERVYVTSYERTKGDEDWLKECRETLLKLQGGDPEALALWQRFVDLSIEELNRIYARLQIRYDLVRGESYYHEKLGPTIDRLSEHKLAERSEGALVVFLEDEKLPPCIVQKSDGGFNYATTDIATIESRVAEFDPAVILYVTDDRQKLHFQQVFSVSRRLGHTVGLEHVAFGLMRLPEGAISTREGTVIKLDDLLDEAERRALSVVEESSPRLGPEQQKAIAREVGIGAVKYADLSQNPQSQVLFTWEKALSLNGNSAPYLQYAHARICSVMDKYAERFPKQDLSQAPIVLGEEIERRLALHLLRFPEAVLQAAESYRPNVLTDYLYDLSGLYSSFYQNLPFLHAEEGVRESRVRLCSVVAATLRKGLELLGIAAPTRI